MVHIISSAALATSVRREFFQEKYVYLDIHQSARGCKEAVEKVLVHPVGQVSDPQRPAGSQRHERLRQHGLNQGWESLDGAAAPCGRQPQCRIAHCQQQNTVGNICSGVQQETPLSPRDADQDAAGAGKCHASASAQSEGAPRTAQAIQTCCQSAQDKLKVQPECSRSPCALWGAC